MNSSNTDIILLEDVFKMKEMKEKELAYYQSQLKELETKMFFLQKEIQLTERIINLIETNEVKMINGS